VNAIPPALSLFETHSHLVRQAATPQHEAISVSFLLSLFSFRCFFAAADAVCAVPRIVSVCSRLLLLDFQCRVLNIPDRLTFCACKPRPPPNQPTNQKAPNNAFSRHCETRFESRMRMYAVCRALLTCRNFQLADRASEPSDALWPGQ
jgi:hypothetical protein